MPQLLKSECPRVCALQQEEPPKEANAPQIQSSPRLLQLEESPRSNKDPAQP